MLELSKNFILEIFASFTSQKISSMKLWGNFYYSRVLRQQPCEPLVLNRRRGTGHKTCVDGSVNGKGRLRLRAVVQDGLWGLNPRLTGGGLRLPPTRRKSCVSVIRRPTQPEPSERRGEAGLT